MTPDSTPAASRHSPLKSARDVAIALPSWIAFKLIKLVIGVLYSLYLGRNWQVASQWRALSAETLRSPLSLPVLMTKGPRWNTHAVIGTVGPFSVERELALDGAAIVQSAGSWTAAIYSYPTYRTVGTLGSLEQARAAAQPCLSESDGSERDGSERDDFERDSSERDSSERNGSDAGAEIWHRLTLPPGRYSIGLRYYQCADSMVFPTVRVDGAAAIPAKPVASEVNQFYGSLVEHTNGFYRFLHSYVYTLLKWRRWLPEGLVRREFLPVGAPETEFFYGAMEQGDRLTLTLASPIVEQFDVYLTVYNRASLPLFWHKVESTNYQSQSIAVDGFYLFRIRPKTPNAESFSASWLQIRLTSQPSPSGVASSLP